MQVYLDYTPALRQGAGVGRYATQLVRALLRQADPGDGFVLGYAGPRAEVRVPPGPAVARRLPLPDRLWRLLLLASYAPLMPPLDRTVGLADLYHGLNWAAPRLRRLPTVITVHDTTFVTHPDCHTRLNRLYLTLAARWSGRAAVRVIADSQATARDTARYLGVAPDRIRVVYPGVEAAFGPRDLAAAQAQVKERFGLTPPYVLFVGTIEPRKNVPALVAAFEQVAATRPELTLALAGGPGWHADASLSAIEQSPARHRIVRLGRVADADLPALYRAAAVFAYPSRYEGFGLPPLEAMACGTPVVVAGVSSLPEVVGDAGLQIDPDRPAELAAAIARLLDTPALAAECAARGLERAARFTWERTARETRAVYHEVLAHERAAGS